MAAGKRKTIAVPRTEVRKRLSALVTRASSGWSVFVGRSIETAYSEFVSPSEFIRRTKRFGVEPYDVEIDRLRQRWSLEREQVENSGRPARITQKGEPIAYLTPTALAQKRKIARTVASVEAPKVQAELASLTKQVVALKDEVKILSNRVLTEKEHAEFRRGLALVRQIQIDWRQNQGLPRIPAG